MPQATFRVHSSHAVRAPWMPGFGPSSVFHINATSQAREDARRSISYARVLLQLFIVPPLLPLLLLPPLLLLQLLLPPPLLLLLLLLPVLLMFLLLLPLPLPLPLLLLLLPLLLPLLLFRLPASQQASKRSCQHASMPAS